MVTTYTDARAHLAALLDRVDVVARDDRKYFLKIRVEIDPDALISDRYERIIEELGGLGRVVLLEADVSESTRQEEAELAVSFFAPDGDLARAEMVPRLRWLR